MPIQHIIIHEVAKEPLSKPIKNLRVQENPFNENAERASSQLAGLFRAVSIGRFQRPENPGLPLEPFEALLKRYFIGTDFSDFVAFSHGATEILNTLMRQQRNRQRGAMYCSITTFIKAIIFCQWCCCACAKVSACRMT